MKPLSFLILHFLFFIAAGAATAATYVIFGTSEGVYWVTDSFPLPLRSYSNANFEQQATRLSGGTLVRLRSTPGKLRLDTPHPAPSPSSDLFLRPIEALPEAARSEALRLGSMCTTRRQVVEDVLDWLSRTVEYRTEQATSQKPAAVLTRKTANCVGLTRSAVAMLRSLDIPARSAHGFQVRLEQSHVVGGAFHRLLEVEYPGVGWIASDVGITKNFLPPKFLVLATEGAMPPEGDWLVEASPDVPYFRSIKCNRYHRDLLVLDELAWPGDRALYSAWTPGHRQSRSTIVGVLLPGTESSARKQLELDSIHVVADSVRGRRNASRMGRWFAISGLLPGSYTVMAQTEHGEIRSDPVRLGSSDFVRIDLDLSPLLGAEKQ